MENTGAKKARTNWLYVALVSTVVYMAFIWLIIGTERLVTFFDNSELNEIGDFLAGVFAPIALIWLVAAVLTQRQELNETREQFEASQGVIEKQMDNANKQASINALHFNLAQESAKKQYRLLLFEKRYEVFNEVLAFIRSHPVQEYRERDLGTFKEIIKKSAFIFNGEVEDWLRDVANKMERLIEEEKGARTIDDGAGNISVQLGTKDHRRIMHLRKEIKDKLSDDELLMRFWKTMRVSDEDEGAYPRVGVFG